MRRYISTMNIKPEIIDYYCSEIDDIEDWIPSDPTDVDYWLTVMIGCDQHGGDNFNIHIVTPINLNQGKESGKHAIILNHYSWQGVIDEINKVLEQCSDITWSGLSAQLSKYFEWEYQGMTPPYM
jgi:hypothetical protein